MALELFTPGYLTIPIKEIRSALVEIPLIIMGPIELLYRIRSSSVFVFDMLSSSWWPVAAGPLSDVGCLPSFFDIQ